jgi:hypothetical protein
MGQKVANSVNEQRVQILGYLMLVRKFQCTFKGDPIPVNTKNLTGKGLLKRTTLLGDMLGPSL